MGVRKTPVGPEIARRLQAARARGSPNRITARQLRGWSREYLGRRDEEIERDPSLALVPHWDLWMMDGRLSDALFAVLIYWPPPRGIEFFCGTGDSFAVRTFCEQDDGDPSEVFQAMRARFTVRRGRLRVNRAAAEKWLGRGW
jgi:hypothetical protein